MNKNSTFYNLLTLTKPGIIIGNVINSFAGFFLASKIYSNYINLFDFIIVIFSIILIIASGCVFNNIYDRDIDKLMNRTKNRPLVQNKISLNFSLFYGVLLGIIGFLLLYIFGNIFSFIAAIIGFVFYVIIYTILLKRGSIYDIHIGSISGAMPPLIAYFFVSNNIDFESIILFITLCFWQIPHSLAIAIYRLQDFQKAKIAIMPIKNGIKITKINILIYIILFAISAIILSFSHFIDLPYIIMISIGLLYWVSCYFKKEEDLNKWAKKILLASIIVIFIFDISLMINYITII